MPDSILERGVAEVRTVFYGFWVLNVSSAINQPTFVEDRAIAVRHEVFWIGNNCLKLSCEIRICDANHVNLFIRAEDAITDEIPSDLIGELSA